MKIYLIYAGVLLGTFAVLSFLVDLGCRIIDSVKRNRRIQQRLDQIVAEMEQRREGVRH